MTDQVPSEFRMTVKNVRLAMLSIWRPFKGRQDDESKGPGKYNLKGLLAPTDPQLKLIDALMVKCAKAKWGAKWEATLKALKVADKTCIHNGDAKPEWEGFEGMMYLSAARKSKPPVRNSDASEVTEADGVVYSGCYGDLYIELWAQDNDFGKRINCTLRGVQFRADGDAFTSGGAPPADDGEFEAIAVTDGDTDSDPLAG